MCFFMPELKNTYFMHYLFCLVYSICLCQGQYFVGGFGTENFALQAVSHLGFYLVVLLAFYLFFLRLFYLSFSRVSGG